LKKAEGKEELITIWQGEWKREFPIKKHYQIRIFVKNIKGEDEAILSFGSACPGVPLGGDYTVATSCTFAYNVDGVDNGNLTIAGPETCAPSGCQLTINAGQTIVWNPGKSVYVNGSIWINKGTPGGQLKKGYICAVDSDSDGYYSRFDFSSVSSCTSTFGGSSKRRSELTSWPASFDCLDSGTGAQYVYQNIASLVTDADHDGYSVGTAATQCVGANTTIGGRTYYKDSSGNYTWLPSGSSLGSDPNDGNACIYLSGDDGLCGIPDNSAGTCTVKAAGEQGLPACKRCDGTSRNSVKLTGYAEDSEGSNLCNATCYGCSDGSCVALTGYAEDSYGSNLCNATCYGCSAGSCVALTGYAEDSYGSNLCNAACKGCSSGSCVNMPAGEDNVGSNVCNLCKRCDGAGTCTIMTGYAEDSEGSYLCNATCYGCSAGSCVALNNAYDTYGANTCSGTQTCCSGVCMTCVGAPQCTGCFEQ
jgi:hypothetical protein